MSNLNLRKHSINKQKRRMIDIDFKYWYNHDDSFILSCEINGKKYISKIYQKISILDNLYNPEIIAVLLGDMEMKLLDNNEIVACQLGDYYEIYKKLKNK